MGKRFLERTGSKYFRLCGPQHLLQGFTSAVAAQKGPWPVRKRMGVVAVFPSDILTPEF